MSKYSLSGTVHAVVKENGTTKKGEPWNKTTVVVDNKSEYNSLVPIVFFGDRASNAVCNEGDGVEIEFYVRGRKWEERYFADISGDSLTVKNNGAPQSVPQPQAAPQPAIVADESDDLPF